MYDGDIASVLITEEQISDKIAELATQIAADHPERRLATSCSSACSRAP